jgi:hypothetical protein
VSNLSRSANLYLRVLLTRQEVMVRAAARKMALGVVAGIFLLGGIALANVALYFWLSPRLGDMGAAALLAALQFAVGAAVMAVAMRQASSKEIAALREAEQAALAILTEEAEGVTRIFAPGDRLGRNLAVGLDLATTLVGLMKKSKGP